MTKLSLALTTALAGLAAAPLQAETIEEASARFGALPTVLDVALSPSGNKLAYITSAGHSAEAIRIADLAAGGAPKQILVHPDPDSELDWCMWAAEDRLVCRVSFVISDSGTLLGFSRMVSISDDGKEVVPLTSRDSNRAIGIQQNGGSILALELEGKPDKILMTRDWVEERSTGTRTANTDEGLGVEEVDIRTSKRRTVESPDNAIIGYTADDKGRVRLKIRQPLDTDGYRRAKREYYYREATSDGWKKFEQEFDFQPVSVDAAKNIAYGFVTKDGHDAIASIALDGSGKTELVLAREDADVDQLLTIGRRNRVVGASYATEKREVAYFDPALKTLSGQLQCALPGKPLVDVIDASADEGKLMLAASSDTDPGMIYLYDKAAKELTELLPLRAELSGRAMGEMKPVSFPAGDGTMIPGYLTLPPGSDGRNLPSIVLPHGGPGSRDEWGFDWLVQFFVARGYAVLQPNFRGSTGYGDAWFGQNGFKAWKIAVGDVNDAGRWLVSSGVADPAKLSIVGWSYGGYAALQSQVMDNTLYKAVVAIAPVTDLGAFRESSRAYSNFTLVNRFVGEGEHIDQGSPARHAASFAAPVLLFHGTLDENVPVDQSTLMKSRLESQRKPVTYVEFDRRDHYIDDAWARTRMLTDIDAFLAKSLGR